MKTLCSEVWVCACVKIGVSPHHQSLSFRNILENILENIWKENILKEEMRMHSLEEEIFARIYIYIYKSISSESLLQNVLSSKRMHSPFHKRMRTFFPPK